MAIRFSIDLRTPLRNFYPGRLRSTDRPDRQARRSCLRNADPVSLFWAIVPGFDVERERMPPRQRT